MQYQSSSWTAATGLSGTDASGNLLTPTNPGPAQQCSDELSDAFLVWSGPDDKFSACACVKSIAGKPVLLNWGAANGFRGPATVALDAPRTCGAIVTASSEACVGDESMQCDGG